MHETQHRVRAAFEGQVKSCLELGSPFTARLCALLAARLTSDHPVGHRILNWPGDPSSRADAVPLRLAGALHALKRRDGYAPLSAFYPPHDTKIGDDALWAAIENAMKLHYSFILEWMTSPPQTNEVRRSNALIGGFLEVAHRFGLPLSTLELGASAGLNLHWSRYRFRFGERMFGPEDSSVHLTPDWRGDPPWLDGTVTVASVAGCDLNPLDPADPDDRERLMAYIWADQSDRLERTAAALDLAAALPVRVEKADAADWLGRRLAMRPDNVATVVCHSIVWQYFPDDVKAEAEALIRQAGLRASAKAPLAWLRMEADGRAPGAAVTLTLWPSRKLSDGAAGARERVVARADFHGRWVEWRGWAD